MTGKRRLNVHLYVTPICNLQCKHCYYDARSPGYKLDRLLTISEISQILRDLSENYAAAFDIEGGEFFLREDIGELFKMVPDCYWHNVTITTNGTVNIEIPPARLRNLDEFRVSVEGHTDALQQDIRGIGIEPILRTCSGLRSNGVVVTLRITIHKRNYEHLTEMISHFVDLGFTRFSMYEFHPVGRGYFHEHEYGLQETEIEQVLGLLCTSPIAAKTEMLKLSLSARRTTLVLKYRQELIARGYDVVDLSGIPSLTINYNGDLGVCPWLIGHDRIGTFRSGELVNDIANYIKTGRLDHKCNYCSAVRILYKQRV